jgi:ariadne-1
MSLACKQGLQLSDVVLCLPPLRYQDKEAAALLRYLKWNKEKVIDVGARLTNNVLPTLTYSLQRYFEDSDKLRAGAGIDNPESSGTSSSSSSSKSQPRIKRIRGFQCQICFDDTEKSPETIALTCDHRYCKDCYTSYLQQKIKEEGEAKEIQCMAPKCNIVMDERTVELLVDEATCDRCVPQFQRVKEFG